MMVTLNIPILWYFKIDFDYGPRNIRCMSNFFPYKIHVRKVFWLFMPVLIGP